MKRWHLAVTFFHGRNYLHAASESGAARAKSARKASIAERSSTVDPIRCPEPTLAATNSVLPLIYVPQHQLKIVLNEIIRGHVSATTYTNTAITMNETDQFLVRMHLEDKLLHSSYNAVSYLDFMLHHFEPGNDLQRAPIVDLFLQNTYVQMTLL